MVRARSLLALNGAFTESNKSVKGYGCRKSEVREPERSPTASNSQPLSAQVNTKHHLLLLKMDFSFSPILCSAAKVMKTQTLMSQAQPGCFKSLISPLIGDLVAYELYLSPLLPEIVSAETPTHRNCG